MRVLAITKIFPNAVEPHSNPFNRQQLAALSRLCEVEVLATIPWFPGARLVKRWSYAGRLSAVPARDVIDGIAVTHPRTLFVPRIGHGAAAARYAASLARDVLQRRGRCDVVLGSWAYPDGAAAVWLARLLGVPSVVKVHGSDINVVAKLPGPRRNLELALPRASRIVAVSRPLADEVVGLGVDRARVSIVSNGVDPELFHPRERVVARRTLALPDAGKLIVYVGRIERTKGVVDLVDAFVRLEGRRPELSLALVGDGSARAELEARRVARVHFAGAQPLARVPLWMAAADVVTLPSWNEGTPNVVLEALACGRPVVASSVGGIPDLINSPQLGELVPAKDPARLAAALERVASGTYDGAEIAKAGARGGWAESAQRLHAVLKEALRTP